MRTSLLACVLAGGASASMMTMTEIPAEVTAAPSPDAQYRALVAFVKRFPYVVGLCPDSSSELVEHLLMTNFPNSAFVGFLMNLRHLDVSKSDLAPENRLDLTLRLNALEEVEALSLKAMGCALSKFFKYTGHLSESLPPLSLEESERQIAILRREAGEEDLYRAFCDDPDELRILIGIDQADAILYKHAINQFVATQSHNWITQGVDIDTLSLDGLRALALALKDLDVLVPDMSIPLKCPVLFLAGQGEVWQYAEQVWTVGRNFLTKLGAVDRLPDRHDMPSIVRLGDALPGIVMKYKETFVTDAHFDDLVFVFGAAEASRLLFGPSVI